MKKYSIHIKESHKGLFTAKAKSHNMGVQEFAEYVMSNKNKFDKATIEQANFAKNAKGFDHKKAQTGKFVPYLQSDTFAGSADQDAQMNAKSDPTLEDWSGSPEGQQAIASMKQKGYKPVKLQNGQVTFEKGTGVYDENPAITDFNILATGVTGVANAISNNNLKQQERQTFIKSIQPKYYENMEASGLNNLPMYTQAGGDTDAMVRERMVKGLAHQSFYNTNSIYQCGGGKYVVERPYGGGPLTSAGAKEILRDGSIKGNPLTEKQKRYFGYIAGGGKPKSQAGGNPQLIINQIAQQIEQGADPDDIIRTLVQKGMDASQATQLVDQAQQFVEDKQSQSQPQQPQEESVQDQQQYGGCDDCAQTGFSAKYAKAGKWIPKHLHKGRCANPGDENCPKGSPQYNLAMTFKKHHGFHKSQAGSNDQQTVKYIAYVDPQDTNKRLLINVHGETAGVDASTGKPAISYNFKSITNGKPGVLSQQEFNAIMSQIQNKNNVTNGILYSPGAHQGEFSQFANFKAGGKAQAGTGNNNASDAYYRSNATLSYFKNILNDKLKAKNPDAYKNYFQGLQTVRTQNALNPKPAQDYVQNTPYNEYLTPQEVQSTLGPDYPKYLESLKQVNTYNVQQGQQPLYGTEEGNQDVNNLNYGRRFASLQVTPTLAVSNSEGTKKYNRSYSYNPKTGDVDWTETGDLGLRPSYVGTDSSTITAPATVSRQTGGNTPTTYGLPDGLANFADVNAEEGEVFQDGGNNIMKVADDAGTHEEGGVNLPNVKRVLENTSSMRKDKASKLLAISPEETQAMFGFKPKKSLSHAEAYEQANENYDKQRKAISSKQKVINSRPALDKYTNNAAQFNFKTLQNVPSQEDVFDMLFGHQEYVKNINSIQDDGSIKKYGGKYAVKAQAGFLAPDPTSSQPDLGLYTGPKNKSGRNLYTPTGLTSEAKNSDQEIVDRYRAVGVDFGDLRGKDLQGAVYNYLIENQPDVLRQTLKMYGPNIQSEKLGLGKNKVFTDPMNASKEDLKAALPGLLDGMIGARLPLPDVNSDSTTTEDQTTPDQNQPAQQPGPLNTGVNINPKFTRQPTNSFHEPTYWDELAPELMSLADSMNRDPELYNPVNYNQLHYKQVDPTAALNANQSDFEAAQDVLQNNPTGSGVNAANVSNLAAQKYKANAQVMAAYDNQNAGIKNNEITYNTHVRDEQSQADANTRATYYRNVQLARENQRQQRLKAIEDLGRVLQMKRRQNNSGNLVLKLSPAFDQHGEYNGYQYRPVLPNDLYSPEHPSTISTKPKSKTSTKTTVNWKVGDRNIKTETKESN